MLMVLFYKKWGTKFNTTSKYKKNNSYQNFLIFAILQNIYVILLPSFLFINTLLSSFLSWIELVSIDWASFVFGSFVFLNGLGQLGG
jgi:hypothetical protein